MRLSSALALTAGLVALAAAPASFADVSTSKGKRICKEAGEAESADGKARVNPRDIRTTDTSLIYRVSTTGADGERANMICVVDKETGEASLSPEAE